MSLFNNRKQQLLLLALVAVLFFVLLLPGLKTNKAVYDKPIEAEKPEVSGKVDMPGLLRRFAGSSDEITGLVDNALKDSLNTKYLDDLEKAGTNNRIDVFVAYASYMKGLAGNDPEQLQRSADLFFEAAGNDPDTLADKTTYSVYAKRACNLILKKDPNNLRALTRKATCAVYLDGSVMEGVTLLRQVESLDSNYAEAQHHLMLLALQSGQYEKAKKRIRKLLSLQPENQQYADILKKLETNTFK